MQPVIIIGSGLAGYTVARELRKLNSEIPLTLITSDDGHFYSKPMLSTALAQNKLPAQLVTAAADTIATQLKLNLVTRTTVLGIDRANARIITADNTYPYSSLILALGADPIRIPLAGLAAADVLSVNHLDDYALFRIRLEGARSVAILGAGLIGCEFANDLAAHGLRVEMLDPSSRPLANLLPENASSDLRDALAALGVRWNLGRSARTVDLNDGNSGLDGRYLLTLDNGSQIAADLVLSAVGLRPRTELAKSAGLQVARGILVDGALRSSDRAIYALGDCAQFGERTLPYVAPIMLAARSIAASLAGQESTVNFPCMPVIIKTPARPVVVAPASGTGIWSNEDTQMEGGLRLGFRDAEGKLRGFVLTGSATSERNAMSKLVEA